MTNRCRYEFRKVQNVVVKYKRIHAMVGEVGERRNDEAIRNVDLHAYETYSMITMRICNA